MALTLAEALRAALLARAPRLLNETVACEAFAAAVSACTAADLTYRASLDEHLSPAAAREVRAATDSFRARVREVRADAVAEVARVAPAGAGAADPLDVVTPRLPGLSHVAAVRVADVSDRARARVAAFRERANAQIAPVLDAATHESLIQAKRVRLAAFRGAVHAVLVPYTSQLERFSDTVEALAAVADGWY